MLVPAQVPDGWNVESGPRGLRVRRLRAPRREWASMLAGGRAEVAVAYGATAGSVARDAGEAIRMERAPGWDVTYALWFDPRGSWVVDPRFRRWLGAAIDARSMVTFVFDDRGEAVDGLLPRLRGEVSAHERPARPFSSGTSPRLSLLYDADDADAETIAARIKAVLQPEGVRVELDGRAGPGYAEALLDRFQVALVAHRTAVADPVLALGQTLAPLGSRARVAQARLERAARRDAPGEREREAREALRPLTSDARLVPLLRLDAWLVTARGLAGVEAGTFGTLHLEAARWTR